MHLNEPALYIIYYSLSTTTVLAQISVLAMLLSTSESRNGKRNITHVNFTLGKEEKYIKEISYHTGSLRMLQYMHSLVIGLDRLVEGKLYETCVK